MRRALSVFVAAAGLAPGAAGVGGEVLIGNMPGNDQARSTFLENGRIKAMGFTLDSENAWLEAVRLRLDITGPDVVPLVRIFADADGVPAELLMTLNNPIVLGVGLDDYRFTPTSRLMFEAGKTYWLVVYNTGGASLSWLASGPSVTPQGQATHAGSLYSSVSGPIPPIFNSPTLNSYEIVTCGPISAADLNADGVVDADDFFLFLELFASGDSRADLNGDETIDANDFFIYLNKFALGC
ncbi:MAG: hypothetical protein JJU33_13630 [Phycisphaerales bacterium]|nr:hypothetical protein [Phycisphaerales bacterium]